MKTYKKMYAEYLERLEEILDQYRNGWDRDYCKENAKIQYYILFGVISYLYRSDKLSYVDYKSFTDEAWKEYQKFVSRQKVPA